MSEAKITTCEPSGRMSEIRIPTPGHIWWRLRRDFQRGFSATWHDYFTVDRILQARLPECVGSEMVPLHLVTGKDYWRMGLWMLASFFYVTGQAWPVVVHDDGSCDSQALNGIARVVPSAQILRRREADRLMHKKLKLWPNTLELRNELPLALKLLDVALLGTAERRLILDCDMLFMNRPGEILEWVEDNTKPDLFLEDIRDASAVPPETFREELGFLPIRCLNSGLCAIHTDLVDLELIETAIVKTALLQAPRRWTVEQTLFAVLAANRPSRLLPPSYMVSARAPASQNTIMRHYIGEVRQQFYGEGLSRMASRLLKAFS
jgi:hypothetical protein